MEFGMAFAATDKFRRLGAMLLAKAELSGGVLKQEGVLRVLKLAAFSLSEPLRSLQLRSAVAADAKRALQALKRGNNKRGLFIDCGSNIGQGYKFFSQYYVPASFDYILVEPNSNCVPHLEALRILAATSIEIIVKAASVKSGQAQLFGPSSYRQEPTYEGCSIVPEHNNGLYRSKITTADLVETFSLSQLILEQCAKYEIIVMKMDIEGAEYDVLDDIISKHVHRHLYAAYVEFHSQYMKKAERSVKRNAEETIRSQLSQDGVLFREWI